MVKVVLNSRSGSHRAEGIFDNDTVTVRQGSKICLIDSYANLPPMVKAKRHDSNVVGDDGVVKQDICFDSPTAAAQFVTGRSVNGYIAWRPENKMSLKEYLKHGLETKKEV